MREHELGGTFPPGNQHVAGFAEGTYRVADYTGSFTNTVINLEPAFLALWPGSRVDVGTVGQVNLVVVPEPSTALCLAGTLVVGLNRRRRASNARPLPGVSGN